MTALLRRPDVRHQHGRDRCRAREVPSVPVSRFAATFSLRYPPELQEKLLLAARLHR